MNRYPRKPGPWRPQGAPYYLDNQRERMGLSPLVTEHPRVKDNRQLNRISMTTAQVCGTYFDGPRRGEDGRSFADYQLNQVRAILENCESEVAKTHAIAAASAEMVDEAYAAFGLESPTRSFRVVVASEAAVESIEVASLRAEVDRLRAENADMGRQLEQLTAPDGDAAQAATPDPRSSLFDESQSPPRHPKSRPPARG